MPDEQNPILELLEHFDKLQLEVLAVHARIHQRLFAILAKRLKCDVAELPDLRFMHAARLAYAGRDPSNAVDFLQKLDSVRNEVAHENNPSKFVEKFAKLAREVLGPNYDDNPATHAAARKQDYATLQFVKVLVDTTNVV